MVAGMPPEQDPAWKQVTAFTCSCSHQSVPGSSAAAAVPWMPDDDPDPCKAQ